MRYIVLTLALCFLLPAVPASAAKKPARSNVKHSKVKHQKPKTARRHARAN